MFGWILRGLRTGIVTTRYPAAPEPQPQGVRNRLTVDPERLTLEIARRASLVCPTGAITWNGDMMRLDLARCIQCGRCVTQSSSVFHFDPDYDLSVREARQLMTTVEVS
jgi:ferredoxin